MFTSFVFCARYIGIICLLSATFNGHAQQTIGLFHQNENAYNGYTLFAPMGYNSVYLIDNCGYLLHEWTSGYAPGQAAYVLPNGNLLHAGRVPSAIFGGGGNGGHLQILDWDSNVLWQYDYYSNDFHQHHDAIPLPNGNILCIAWEYRSYDEAIQAGRNPATLAEPSMHPLRLVELQPVGSDEANIVWEWHLWDHLVQHFNPVKDNYASVTAHQELVDINYGHVHEGGDWIHANAISYHEGRDQILISARNFNEIWVIDHSTTTEEAASHEGGTYGRGGDLLYRWGNPQAYNRGTAIDRKLFKQHNAQWIPDSLPHGGKVMVYNNGVERPDGEYSSIDIIDVPFNADGSYTAPTTLAPFPPTDVYSSFFEPISFFSAIMSSAQMQPNGNLLICEGTSGRFFEVDSLGNMVWEYVNPVGSAGPRMQGQMAEGFGAWVFKTERYAKNYVGFQNQVMNASAPIEIAPIPYPCDTIGDVIIGATQVETSGGLLQVRQSHNQLQIDLTSDNNLHKNQLHIYNIYGQLIHRQTVPANSFVLLNIEDWLSGVYLIVYGGKSCKIYK